MLKDKAKVFEAISTMRTAYEKEAKQVATKAEESKRASVEAIENAKKFQTTKPPKQSRERQQEAQENLRDEARRRSNQSGVDAEVIERDLVAKQEGNPLAVDTEDLPGAPFYRCLQRGGQRVLLINVAHPFYTELYAGKGSSPRLRAGLEILLWSLGEAEVDADPESDRRRFYEKERGSVWSPYIADALTSLRGIEVVADESPDQADAA